MSEESSSSKSTEINSDSNKQLPETSTSNVDTNVTTHSITTDSTTITPSITKVAENSNVTISGDQVSLDATLKVNDGGNKKVACDGDQKKGESQDRPKSIEPPVAINSTNQNIVYSAHHTFGQPYSAPQLSPEQQLAKSKKDLESMVLKYAKSEQENLQNKIKVEELDKKLKRAIKDNDQLANRIKLLTNDKSQLTDTLNAKLAQLTVLEQKNSFLNNAQGVKLKEYEDKIRKLENSNEELLKQIETYKLKEGELLDFSERLSMKHMMLQSELNEALKKVPNFKEEYESTLQERDSVIQETSELNKEIEMLKVSLENERELLKNLRSEKGLQETRYRTNLDALQNEIKVMRRKHQIATKELVKEIKHLQVQLEKVEKQLASSSPTTTTTTTTSAATKSILTT